MVSDLRDLVEGDDPEVALAAAEALFGFTGDGAAAVELRLARFASLLDQGRQDRRKFGDVVWELAHLRRYGPQAAPAVSRLIEALDLEGSRKGLPDQAVGVLGAIGPGAGAAVPAIVEFAARSAGSDSQKGAIRALAEIGAASRLALPLLVRFLDHEHREIREASRTAIEKIVEALRREDTTDG